MSTLQVAVYARVSSEQQTEDGTIASQIAALETRVVQDGHRLPAAFRFVDDGYSGATLSAQPWNGCVMRLRRATSSASTSMRPIGWRAASVTKSCCSMSSSVPAWK